jgi:ketosteroid isomerase-like protein
MIVINIAMTASEKASSRVEFMERNYSKCGFQIADCGFFDSTAGNACLPANKIRNPKSAIPKSRSTGVVLVSKMCHISPHPHLRRSPNFGEIFYMKTITKLSLIAVAAFALIGCAPPANTNTNTAANTNANAAPRAAAPTVDTFMPMENKAFEAWKNKDGKYFEGYIADNFVPGPGEGDMTKAQVVKMITEGKCDVKSFALSDGRVTPVGADAAVFTYKATADGTCEGKAIPSPVTAASVFVRSGDTWKAVYHNEVPIIAPKDDAKADANATNKGAAPPENKASATAPAAKEEKTNDTNKTSAPTTNSNSSASSNSNKAASSDALTDALMTVERKGWEAWKNQDAKAMDEVVGADVTFVDITGKATFGKADVIKGWTDGSCKVSSVSVSDGKAMSITKDAAILTFKGTAVGTCGDMKLEPLWGTTVAVKEGDTWKAVYIFETPIRKM